MKRLIKRRRRRKQNIHVPYDAILKVFHFFDLSIKWYKLELPIETLIHWFTWWCQIQRKKPDKIASIILEQWNKAIIANENILIQKINIIYVIKTMNTSNLVASIWIREKRIKKIVSRKREAWLMTPLSCSYKYKHRLNAAEFVQNHPPTVRRIQQQQKSHR